MGQKAVNILGKYIMTTMSYVVGREPPSRAIE